MRRFTLCTVLMLGFGLVAVSAQAAGDPTMGYAGNIHFTLKANNGASAFDIDLPMTSVEDDGDTFIFSDGATTVTMTPWRSGEWNIKLTIKGKPYQSATLNRAANFQSNETGEFYSMTLAKNITLSGTTMNVPTAYTLYAGSVITLTSY